MTRLAFTPVEPGEVIDNKYEILSRLGKGGMGVVFEARHRVVGRKLAIKFIQPEAAEDPKRRTRFLREARACGALHHENIASVLDFAEDGKGRPYIVMELVPGCTLRTLLEQHGRLAEGRAIDLVCQAASGLRAAHENGILHRDIKPENLVLTTHADGTDWLKLVDFGVARISREHVTKLTRDGVTPGTVDYLSPELARGEAAASEQSDIYALGVVLFELLTGERPHPGANENAVLQHVANRPPRSVETLRSGLTVSLVDLVQRTLSPNPAHRPASVTEFIDALRAVSATRDFDSPATSTSESAEPTAASADPQTLSAIAMHADESKRPLQMKGVRFGLMIAGLMGFTGALYVAVRSATVEAPPPGGVAGGATNSAPRWREDSASKLGRGDESDVSRDPAVGYPSASTKVESVSTPSDIDPEVRLRTPTDKKRTTAPPAVDGSRALTPSTGELAAHPTPPSTGRSGKPQTGRKSPSSPRSEKPEREPKLTFEKDNPFHSDESEERTE